MQASTKQVKEQVIDSLENLGWILGTENDMNLVTYAFQKAMCDQMFLVFNSLADDEITVHNYTYNPEMWPDHVFDPVKGNDNFVRVCTLKLIDAKGKAIEERDIANFIVKWLLIPGAEIPNMWNTGADEKPKTGTRSEETDFMKAQKRNAARRAAKAAAKK